MNSRALCLIVFLLISFCSKGQTFDSSRSNKEFKCPVLAKLIRGEGNVFRIGFVRTTDFCDNKDSLSYKYDMYDNFIKKADLNGKCFVFFPSAKDSGEMLIVDRDDFVKIDMDYNEAMGLILPNQRVE